MNRTSSFERYLSFGGLLIAAMALALFAAPLTNDGSHAPGQAVAAVQPASTTTARETGLAVATAMHDYETIDPVAERRFAEACARSNSAMSCQCVVTAAVEAVGPVGFAAIVSATDGDITRHSAWSTDARRLLSLCALPPAEGPTEG